MHSRPSPGTQDRIRTPTCCAPRARRKRRGFSPEAAARPGRAGSAGALAPKQLRATCISRVPSRFHLFVLSFFRLEPEFFLVEPRLSRIRHFIVLFGCFAEVAVRQRTRFQRILTRLKIRVEPAQLDVLNWHENPSSGTPVRTCLICTGTLVKNLLEILAVVFIFQSDLLRL